MLTARLPRHHGAAVCVVSVRMPRCPCGMHLTQVRHAQVRNSAGGIVQLSYGEDNLDPVAMEDAGGKPINLPRSLSVVHASLPQQPRIPENASDEGEQGSPSRQSKISTAFEGLDTQLWHDLACS